MKIQARSIATTLGLVALGVVMGVAGSQRYWFHRSMELLEAEVVGRANVDVLALSMWRTGSEDDALERRGSALVVSPLRLIATRS